MVHVNQSKNFFRSLLLDSLHNLFRLNNLLESFSIPSNEPGSIFSWIPADLLLWIRIQIPTRVSSFSQFGSSPLIRSNWLMAMVAKSLASEAISKFDLIFPSTFFSSSVCSLICPGFPLIS